ncbi:hypothetical protein [Anaeromyxobacter sp. SG64]|uniref:hypothetical protein n=1 Tax=Anaeromyxobacter sp. SG64 TaxID=2925409 RepID=UPI001F564E8D|nr:hypothetical protein [Anaeromyxobacter sp. SG64]
MSATWSEETSSALTESTTASTWALSWRRAHLRTSAYFREDPSPHYFTTLQDWEDEAEYRLLVSGDGTERPYD